MLGKSSCGCCLGMVIGLLLAVFLLVAAAFGIYCWFNPEARQRSIDTVEHTWTKVKTGVDNSIEQVRRDTNTPAATPEKLPAKVPQPPAEPEIF